MLNRARAVVVGGGVGGCSILYWLARLGWDDVVLVERAELTSGSTVSSRGLRGAARWKRFGLPLGLVSGGEAQALFPPMTAEGVLGAAFLPTDGYIDPSQLTFALAEGARRRGAEINQRTRVTGIRLSRGRVQGVE